MRKSAGMTLLETVLAVSLLSTIILAGTSLARGLVHRMRVDRTKGALWESASRFADVLALQCSVATEASIRTENGVQVLNIKIPSTTYDVNFDGWTDWTRPTKIDPHGHEYFASRYEFEFYMGNTSLTTVAPQDRPCWAYLYRNPATGALVRSDWGYFKTFDQRLRYPGITGMAFSIDSSAKTITITITASNSVHDIVPGQSQESSPSQETVTISRTVYMGGVN